MAEQQRDAADVLRSSAFSRGTSPGFDIEAPDAQAILRSLDASNLHPLAASLNKGELDYLVLDDGRLNQLEGAASVLPSRGWSDELCCATHLSCGRSLMGADGTGTTYLSGSLEPLRRALLSPQASLWAELGAFTRASGDH